MNDDRLPEPPQDLLASFTAQAVELGLVAPTVEDGIILIWLDEARLFRAFCTESEPAGLAIFLTPLWPVAEVSLDEVKLLTEAMGDSLFAIEIRRYEPEDPDAEPELWFEATAEVPVGEAAVTAEGVLSDSLNIIADSEDRIGSLQQHYQDQVDGAILAAASCVMAMAVQQLEGDEERSARMIRVVQEKKELLISTYSDMLDFQSDDPAIDKILSYADDSTSRLILLDCAFAEAFAPYDIPLSDSDRSAALETLASALGVLGSADVSQLMTIRGLEIGKHSSLREPKAVVAVAAGAVTLVAVAIIATPAGAAAVGGLGAAGAGLTGAAATAHGLALLGGGSIAAHGLGMAGGLWILGAAGVAGGAALTAGTLGSLAIAAGPDAARLELVKLQTSMAWLNFDDDEETSNAISALAANAEATTELLDAERDRSDPDSARVRALERTLDAIETAVDSISSPYYDSKDQVFAMAERGKGSAKVLTRRAKRMFSQLSD